MTRIQRPADVRFDFELSALTMLDPHESWTSWLTMDSGLVAGTLSAVEHEGRPAWRFTAPREKGGSPVPTVDAELGLVVRSWRDDVGCASDSDNLC